MIFPNLIDLIILTSTRGEYSERKLEKMETKYGTITQEQFEEHKKQLHAMIHWLLVYKEKDYADLDNYFSSVLFRINGLNSVLNYPPNMLTLMATLESARLENQNPNFDHKKYRKAILDAHAIVDQIGEYEIKKAAESETAEEVVPNTENNTEETVVSE